MTKSTKILAGLGVVAALGVAALPLMSYATVSVSGDVTLSVDVNEAIAMTIKGNEESSANVDVYTPTGASTIDGHTVGTLFDDEHHQVSSSHVSILPNSADTTTATSEIKVYTNAAGGFALSVKDADSTTALVNEDDSSATIPAGTTITAGTAAWGYKGGSVTNFAAISATDAPVYTQSAPTSGGATINMTYGVSTASDQKTGTYSDTIIYTATTQ